MTEPTTPLPLTASRADQIFPRLTSAQIERVATHGRRRAVRSGEVLVEQGDLILVDSSVWIDFLGSSPSFAGAELRRMIVDAEPFALAGVVITEVLQGLKREVSRLEHYLSQWEMLEPRGFSTYREAAAIFRAARAKDVADTTIDALIAAIASEHGATLFTLDKDFSRLAGITRLPLYVF